jgi:hypothetical protein
MGAFILSCAAIVCGVQVWNVVVAYTVVYIWLSASVVLKRWSDAERQDIGVELRGQIYPVTTATAAA